MSVKAFELVPAVEREKFLLDKSKTEIECIECCGKNLYVGTDNCFVFHFKLEEDHIGGRTTYHCTKQGHKFLNLRKPIAQLKAASALNRIVVLCDGILTFLNMFDLEPVLSGSKIKGVTCFCLNENPARANPFSIEICVALKKKVLQIYTFTEDKMIHSRDVVISEPALTLSLDGAFICYATANEYNIINYEDGYKQTLFPYDSDSDPHTVPYVKRISKEEFLLSGPNALGMFVTTAGISQRPPLQWNEGVSSVGYKHPYLLAMNDEFITVHSIIDQQQKQTMPFQGKHLGDFDGKIFVASSREVYALVPIAWQKQIQALLGDKRVEEALELARNSPRAGLSQDKFQKTLKRIQLQAGFIQFAENQLAEAKDLFVMGDLDVRELISVYPSLLPIQSGFTRSVPPLHEIPNLVTLCSGDEDRMVQYKDFLVDYLQHIRDQNSQNRLEIDTALLKIYAETNSAQLVDLIGSQCSCDLQEGVDHLQKYGCYFSLGLLYKNNKEYDKTMQVWSRVQDGHYNDEHFPGLDFIVEFLSSLSDHDLVWKYADWVMEKDQELGVKIFTQRPSDEVITEKMRPDNVIDYLHRFPKSVIGYLEHLVFTNRLEKEKYHTHLAVLYLDHVLQLIKNTNIDKQLINIARSKLKHMLQVSNLYRVQLILSKVKETELYEECAILYGKLEEHEKAIRILVHKLRNYEEADKYCLFNSEGKEATYRKKLFQILLGVYLDPSYERRDLLIQPAVLLLNSKESTFDTLKVLQLLPENWSVGLLANFLLYSVRHSLNDARTTHIQRMLLRGENLNKKQMLIELKRHPVNMTEDRLCSVCQRGFSDCSFAQYPNGVITHVHCAKNKTICPVTGRIFKTTQPRK